MAGGSKGQARPPIKSRTATVRRKRLSGGERSGFLSCVDSCWISGQAYLIVIMANQTRETVPWLNAKLSDSWSSLSVTSTLTKDVMRSIKEHFILFSVEVKLRLLISCIGLRKLSLKELEADIKDLCALAMEDDDDWVQAMGAFISSFADRGVMAFDELLKNQYFAATVVSLKNRSTLCSECDGIIADPIPFPRPLQFNKIAVLRFIHLIMRFWIRHCWIQMPENEQIRTFISLSRSKRLDFLRDKPNLRHLFQRLQLLLDRACPRLFHAGSLLFLLRSLRRELAFLPHLVGRLLFRQVAVFHDQNLWPSPRR